MRVQQSKFSAYSDPEGIEGLYGDLHVGEGYAQVPRGMFLCQCMAWLCTLYHECDVQVALIVEPKKAQLAEAQASLDITLKALEAARDKLKVSIHLSTCMCV